MNKLICLPLLAWMLSPMSMVAWAADDLMSSQLVDEARQWSVKGRDDLATNIWQKVLISDPQHGEALVNLGLILAKEGNLDTAQRLYSRASKLPKAPSGLSKLTAMLATAAPPVKPLTREVSPFTKANISPKASKPFKEGTVTLQAQSIAPKIPPEASPTSLEPTPKAVLVAEIKPAETAKVVVRKPRPCRIPLPSPTQI